METLELIKRLEKLQKEYKALYAQGLVGIGCDYIHVTGETFQKIVPKEHRKVTSQGIHLHVSGKVRGTVFITLVDVPKKAILSIAPFLANEV